MTAVLRHEPATAVRGRRVAAFVIDLVLYTLATVGAYLAMADRLTGAAGAGGCPAFQDAADGVVMCMGFKDEIRVLEGGSALTFVVAALGLWILYFGVVQGLTGATLGKLLLRIRVVRADGAVCGVPRGVLRQIPFIVGWLLVGFGMVIALLIETALMLSSRNHQRSGDLLARTFVVRADAVGHPPARPVEPA